MENDLVTPLLDTRSGLRRLWRVDIQPEMTPQGEMGGATRSFLRFRSNNLGVSGPGLARVLGRLQF
jgi:hypothetical protein